MVYWYTGRYGKNVERKMTVFFDKINKSILFVPKMKMDTTLTLDGEKISEFVFDNTQAKKHIKFFWAPDAFTKDYLFTDEWEYTGTKGIKWNTDLKRGGVSIWNYVGDYSWVNNANKFEIKMMDKIVQTPMSPFYGWDHFLIGIYYKTGDRTRTITYDKKNRNFLLGKLLLRTRSWRRARSSTTSSWTPGPLPTPWSGSTSLSEACSQPPGTSPARMN